MKKAEGAQEVWRVPLKKKESMEGGETTHLQVPKASISRWLLLNPVCCSQIL